MQEVAKLNKARVQIYFCGGTALNVATGFHNPDVEVAYLDTCDKNITPFHDMSKVFLTQGTRGAGKNRKFILPLIRPQVPVMMNRFPAADFNIIVFGTSGGSGNTIGALILNELLKADETVMCLGITGIESTEVLNNSVDTLKTLEGISINRDKNVVLCHLRNTAGVTFEKVNEEAAFYLDTLCELASQNNARLDVTDVSNWINFNHKVGTQAQLLELTIHTTRQEASAVPEMISVASLYTDPAQEIPYGSPFVRTTGISTSDSMPADQLHFVINTVGIDEIMKDINDLKAESHRHQVRYRQRNSTLDIDDNRDEDGFVV